MHLDELLTPCAVVDLDVVERNTARMADRARSLGVRLRPHVKTHATVEGARLSVRGHDGGVTVSTLAEARALIDDGFRDLTWAVPVPAPRLVEALELGRSVERLSLLVDTEAAAVEVERAAEARGVTAPVFLKVDCGYHRAGVDPARPESALLAARLSTSERLEFRGLLTHAGHAYSCRTRDDVRVVAEQERDVPVTFAKALRADGVVVPEISIGSTPTAWAAEDLTGVTEIRPGNHVFHDVFQATIGSCGPTDLAFSVLTSVIGVHERPRRLVLDAGALALSKDPGATHVQVTPGFGWLATLDGRLLGGATVTSISQQHGLATLGPVRLPAWGSRLRVLPNHSCLAAACFDRFFVARGDEVVDEWVPAHGW